MTELEQYATEDAAGNDRGKWPYVVGVEERIAAGAAQRVALDRENPEPAPEADEREAVRAVISSLVDRIDDPRVDFYVEVDVATDAVLRAFARRSQPAPRTVSAAEVARATRDACVEAGWDWSGEPSAGIPSPEHQMRPVVQAILAALDITVEAPRG